MKIDFYHSASRARHKKELALSNFIEKQRILSFYLQIFCAQKISEKKPIQ